MELKLDKMQHKKKRFYKYYKNQLFMKTLTQHIKESLINKPIKKVETKSVEEDLSDLMRTSPKDREITRGTLRNENDKNIN